MEPGLFANDKNGKPKVINKGVEIDIKMNTFVMDVFKNLIEYLVDQYGIENFLIASKEIIENKRPPNEGFELYITMLSAIIALFEQTAMEQGHARELTDEEMEIFKKKMDEYDQKYGKINGN